MLQMVVDKMPEIISAMSGPLQAVGNPLAGIDKVVMIDAGGGASGNGATNMQKFAGNVPAIAFSFMEQLGEVTGLDLRSMLGRAMQTKPADGDGKPARAEPKTPAPAAEPAPSTPKPAQKMTPLTPAAGTQNGDLPVVQDGKKS